MITEPGVYDIPAEEYHADPVPGGSLSSSGARRLLPPSCPAIFDWERTHPVRKDIFDLGQAAHKVALGDESAQIVEVEADDWRTKAAQSAKSEAREQGLIPLLAKDYRRVQDMAQALRDHPVASRLLDPSSGEPEKTLVWRDEQAGIWRRVRLDWMRHPRSGRMIICDYKTARSAEKTAFAKSAVDHGYHMQDDWYSAGVAALGLDSEPAFVFIAQEKTAPYVVNVIELDGDAKRIGRIQNVEAMQIYRRCVESGRWPGYSDEIELASLPYWYTREYDGITA